LKTRRNRRRRGKIGQMVRLFIVEFLFVCKYRKWRFVNINSTRDSLASAERLPWPIVSVLTQAS
jgi:hypothetical protein